MQKREKKRRIIVNADDFGLSENINEGILHAHANGIVTSASIVAQGEAFNHAAGIAKNNPSLDIGIHLTLVEEYPIVASKEIPTIVNNDGKFFPHAKDFFKIYMLGKISPGDVYKELDAQMRKVISSGIKITHIDSHQHIHVLKDVFKVILDLALKYEIPVIRIPYESIKPSEFYKNMSPRLISLAVLNFISKKRKKENILYTDCFAGFLFGGNLNKENLLEILRNLPDNGVCEIMCHPGIQDPSSKYSHWKYNWGTELNSLINPEIKDFINEQEIELINFYDFSKIKGVSF